MLFLTNPKLLLISAVILIGALVTAALLNKYTPLAWDPALVVSYGTWVGVSLIIWIVRKLKKRN